MQSREIKHIVAAVVVLWILTAFIFIIKSDYTMAIIAIAFSLVILLVNILGKKIMAYLLDSNVEHSIWVSQRYGFRPHQHYKKELPFGIIIPLIITLVTFGFVKFPAILTYETSALKKRSARRFGIYSYTSMTDFHNGLIGAAGIVANLVLAIIIYSLPWNMEYFAGISIFYAFCNILPISKLDGTQIFFGSRVLWTTLAAITGISLLYALILV